MTLFDTPKQEKLSDVFPPGTLFWLLDAKYEGIQPTTFGDSAQAAVTVCAVDDTQNTRQFRVFGTLAEQVATMEEGDLPAEVDVVKSGRKNVWRLSKKLPANVREEAAPPTDSEESEETPF